MNIRKQPLRTLVLVYWVIRFFYYSVKERSLAFLRFYPGYHGSTIPSLRVVLDEREQLFDADTSVDDGIDMNRSRQLELLEKFTEFYADFQPAENQVPDRLYWYNNPMFGFSDAFSLYGIFRTFRPARVLEIGSGYSSALMLDLSREFLPHTRFTFVDPYSTTIGKVLANHPEGHYELIREQAQDLDLVVFRELNENDVLFIDTSHVVKIGSDLSVIFFAILPSLKPGVLVHIHDIYYPWEYPVGMVMEGRTYNEVYFVRAFLQFNDAFEIVFNTSQMERENPEFFNVRMPGYFKSTGHQAGQSLWLRKKR